MRLRPDAGGSSGDTSTDDSTTGAGTDTTADTGEESTPDRVGDNRLDAPTGGGTAPGNENNSAGADAGSGADSTASGPRPRPGGPGSSPGETPGAGDTGDSGGGSGGEGGGGGGLPDDVADEDTPTPTPGTPSGGGESGDSGEDPGDGAGADPVQDYQPGDSAENPGAGGDTEPGFGPRPGSYDDPSDVGSTPDERTGGRTRQRQREAIREEYQSRGAEFVAVGYEDGDPVVDVDWGDQPGEIEREGGPNVTPGSGGGPEFGSEQFQEGYVEAQVERGTTREVDVDRTDDGSFEVTPAAEDRYGGQSTQNAAEAVVDETGGLAQPDSRYGGANVQTGGQLGEELRRQQVEQQVNDQFEETDLQAGEDFEVVREQDGSGGSTWTAELTEQGQEALRESNEDVSLEQAQTSGLVSQFEDATGWDVPGEGKLAGERTLGEQFGDIDWSFGMGGEGDEVEQGLDAASQAISQTAESVGSDLFTGDGAASESLGQEVLAAAGYEGLGRQYEQSLSELGQGIVSGTGSLGAQVPQLVTEAPEFAGYAATNPVETAGKLPGAIAAQGVTMGESTLENPAGMAGSIIGSGAAAGGLFKATQGTRFGMASRVALQPGEELVKAGVRRGALGSRAAAVTPGVSSSITEGASTSTRGQMAVSDAVPSTEGVRRVARQFRNDNRGQAQLTIARERTRESDSDTGDGSGAEEVTTEDAREAYEEEFQEDATQREVGMTSDELDAELDRMRRQQQLEDVRASDINMETRTSGAGDISRTQTGTETETATGQESLFDTSRFQTDIARSEYESRYGSRTESASESETASDSATDTGQALRRAQAVGAAVGAEASTGQADSAMDDTWQSEAQAQDEGVEQALEAAADDSVEDSLDVGVETMTEAGTDTVAEPSIEQEVRTGGETGFETGFETGAETGFETGVEWETERETERERESELQKDPEQETQQEGGAWGFDEDAFSSGIASGEEIFEDTFGGN